MKKRDNGKDEKLNGRRRELLGNWKPATGQGRYLVVNLCRSRRAEARKPAMKRKGARRDHSNINSDISPDESWICPLSRDSFLVLSPLYWRSEKPIYNLITEFTQMR